MKYSFRKSLEEIAQLINNQKTADFGSAEMVNVFWETKPEIIEYLLPPPLEMPKMPLAHGFIANYPETNFGLPYQESALFIRATFAGVEGNYCLAMHLDGPGKDLAMAGGREFFGFPKKQTKILFNYKGDEFEGYSERNGTRNMELKVKFTGKFNDEDALKFIIGSGMMGSGRMKNPDTINYNYKYFPAPDRSGYDYYPRLVQQNTLFRPETIKLGEAKLKLESSVHDPWAELEIVKVLGAIYQEGNNSMASGKVLAEIDPKKFLEYGYLKWDWHL